MSLALIVSFLNEAPYLPTFLASLERQTRQPDVVLLVDDGSADGSGAIVDAFAAGHPTTHVLRRPRREVESDRLATAPELKSFEWAWQQLDTPYDIVVKMDADLELQPMHIETMEAALQADPTLGIAGGHLSMVLPDGSVEREKRAIYHVRGPNKFYRRECLEQIQPINAILGWDTIDDVKARMAGWRTTTVEVEGGDSIHLRPTGTHDGSLRGYARWGQCAFAVGTPFPAVLAGAAVRAQQHPRVLGGLAYVYGWARSIVRRDPRAEAGVRSYYRTEQYRRMARPVLSRVGITVDSPSSPQRRTSGGTKRSLRDQGRRLRRRGAHERCPCCDRDVVLEPFRGRRNAQCPACGALERHRALAGYLVEHLSPDARVLHFAPEPFLVPLFLRRTSHYVAADLFPEATNVARNVDVVKADIMDLPFPDESFDVAVVSHVLEHVEDDKKALSEVRRTLRVGGSLIAQHPWFPELKRTVADPGETDPDERLRRFGQADHVRKYGRDYFDVLRSSGFEVDVLPSPLPPGNHVAVCTRSSP